MLRIGRTPPMTWPAGSWPPTARTGLPVCGLAGTCGCRAASWSAWRADRSPGRPRSTLQPLTSPPAGPARRSDQATRVGQPSLPFAGWRPSMPFPLSSSSASGCQGQTGARIAAVVRRDRAGDDAEGRRSPARTTSSSCRTTTSTPASPAACGSAQGAELLGPGRRGRRRGVPRGDGRHGPATAGPRSRRRVRRPVGTRLRRDLLGTEVGVGPVRSRRRPTFGARCWPPMTPRWPRWRAGSSATPTPGTGSAARSPSSTPKGSWLPRSASTPAGPLDPQLHTHLVIAEPGAVAGRAVAGPRRPADQASTSAPCRRSTTPGCEPS